MNRWLSIAARVWALAFGHCPRVIRAAEGAPAVALSSVPPTTRDVPLNRPLRVLTANILNRTEPYAERMRLLRQQLVKLDPDVMGFQEAAWTPGAAHHSILVGWPHHYRGRARVVSCRVVLNEPAGKVWPSDHFGVLAEVSCPP